MRITICTDGEQGYHLLWTVDIYHGDPSLGNMAMRRDKDGHFYGVRTDWDLANIGQLKECRSDWRTGPTPFMAIDVLNGLLETYSDMINTDFVAAQLRKALVFSCSFWRMNDQVQSTLQSRMRRKIVSRAGKWMYVILSLRLFVDAQYIISSKWG